MNATVTSYKRCEVVKYSGFLEGREVDGLEAFLENLIKDQKYNLVLDLSDVPLVASKGLRMFIAIQRKCAQHRGKLVLACVNERIKSALRLVGMYDFFEIHDQIIDAVASF